MMYYRVLRLIMYLGIFLQAIHDKEYWSMITPAILALVELTDYLAVKESRS